MQRQPWVSDVRPVQTNIVIFDLQPPLMTDAFLKKLGENGMLAAPFGPATVRFVTHLDFTEEMLGRVVDVVGKMRF